MLKSAKMHAQNNILHNCFLWSKFSMKKLTFLHQKSIVKNCAIFLQYFLHMEFISTKKLLQWYLLLNKYYLPRSIF
jgi:hypothetical protein